MAKQRYPSRLGAGTPDRIFRHKSIPDGAQALALVHLLPEEGGIIAGLPKDARTRWSEFMCGSAGVAADVFAFAFENQRAHRDRAGRDSARFIPPFASAFFDALERRILERKKQHR